MNNAMTLLELNQLVAETLEGAFPDTYWVQGELSEGRVGYGGHFYGELVERRVDSPKGRSQGAELVAKARVNCWQNIFARVSAKFARATGESLRPGMKVVVVEDLISTGGSSLKAVEAIRANGCEVIGMVAAYTYGFDVAVKAFKEAGVKLITLTNYEAVVDEALRIGYIRETDIELLNNWRQDPAHWNS